MTEVDNSTLKKFSKHVLECRSHSSQLPKDLLELQGYLAQLNTYVERYRDIRRSLGEKAMGSPTGSVASQGKSSGSPTGSVASHGKSAGSRTSSREMSFSVKEEIVIESPEVEIIEMDEQEPITVISSAETSEKPAEEGDDDDDDDESDVASMFSLPEGDAIEEPETAATGGDADDAVSGRESDESEIGIYFIDDVHPVRLIKIIQRELCALSKMFPSVADIVREISNEFEHFKICCSCLKKVSPVLPDILRELQELIKFIKKKRNEPYSWPNDSEYLRKSSEAGKPFKKEEDPERKKKVREETVGYVTVHRGNSRSEAVIRGLRASHGQTRVVHRRSLISGPYTALANDSGGRWNGTVSVVELAAAQALRVLHPEPIVEKVLQLRAGESVKWWEGSGFVALPRVSSSNESSGTGTFFEEEYDRDDPIGLKAEEFLLTARVALGQACLELQMDAAGHREKMESDRELTAEVRDLKGLMIDVHKNQIELSKVLLEKGVLNPVVVQLTDPRMLHEEKKGIQRAKTGLSEVGRTLDERKTEELQQLVDDLKRKCSTKNRLIIALLNGLRSNVPKDHWDDLINFMLQDSDSIQELAPDAVSDFLRRSDHVRSEHEKMSRKYPEWSTGAKKELLLQENSYAETTQREYGKDTRRRKGQTWAGTATETPSGHLPLPSSSLFEEDPPDGDEWIDLIKALRVAEDDVRHLQRTNTYVDSRLGEILRNGRSLREDVSRCADILREVQQMEMIFNKAIMSVVTVREAKSVKFVVDLPRKSRSDESSSRKGCTSCGLVLRDKRSPVPCTRREKARRRKGYGRYCAACGVVEVSSQSSIFRCYDCDGEIIIQSLCSSCDSVAAPSRKRNAVSGAPCVTCDTIKRKRICWEESEVELCNKCRTGMSRKQGFCIYHEKEIRPGLSFRSEERSYCSECELTSASSDCRNDCSNLTSADSLLPWSDADNLTNRHRDWEVISSVSSSGTEKVESFSGGKSSPFARLSRSGHEQLSRVAEETVSLDEEFNTPTEVLSSENVTQSREDDLASDSFEEEKAVTDLQASDRNEGMAASTDSEEYSEAPESPSTKEDPTTDDQRSTAGESFLEAEESSSRDTVTTGEFVYPPELDRIAERMRTAQEALRELSADNSDLENGIENMENVSQQNVKLSAILREIILGMSSHLEFIQRETHGPRCRRTDDSDSMEEFEEAVEELSPSLLADSDSETYYDIPHTSHCYLCLECGITTSHAPMASCSSCNRQLREIPNGFLGDGIDPPSDGDADKTAAAKHRTGVNAEGLTVAFPLLLNSDLSRFPLTVLENRLKCVEKETGFLKDNNDIVNVLIDDLQQKLVDDLKSVQTTQENVKSAAVEASETTIVGFDVSVYQFCRLIKEKKTDSDSLQDEAFVENVRSSTRTFLEMKIEEVFMKEQQRALELEVIEQKLQVEGFIIKEKESFHPCAGEPQKEKKPSILALTKKSNKEGKEGKNDGLVISIEIEVEKESRRSDRKSLRCEYKANLERDASTAKTLPTITLYPMWSNAECVTSDNRKMAIEEADALPMISSDIASSNHDDVDFVEIKSPKFFYGSSDDDAESCAGDCADGRRRRKCAAVRSLTVSPALKSATVLLPEASPYATVLRSPSTEDDTQEEYFEAKSDGFVAPGRTLPLIRFFVVNLGGSSAACIASGYGVQHPVVVTEIVEEYSTPEGPPPELDKALTLIREIQNEVVEVKLDCAIEILPQLESVLREHIRDTVKDLTPSSTTSGLDVFTSALNLLSEGPSLAEICPPREMTASYEAEEERTESDERLTRMMDLLSGLEKAVRKMSEERRCRMEPEAQKVFHMLKSLSERILEARSDVDEMEKTAELTSELDVAVRRLSASPVAGSSSSSRATSAAAEDSDSSALVAVRVNSVKKKIFDEVASEAQQREQRIERDFDRIDKLERENAEVLLFLDTLLDKTLRRVYELDEVRRMGEHLRQATEEFLAVLGEAKNRREPVREMAAHVERPMPPRFERFRREPTLPSIQEVSTGSDEESGCETKSRKADGTLSNLIEALDNLKARAQEKKVKCRGIFEGRGSTGEADPLHVAEEVDLRQNPCKRITSKITHFSRIGSRNFFMTWTKPEPESEGSAVVGYEIIVNGKVNQRVRNPNRLKAVLYSVNPNEAACVRLCALTNDGRRRSLTEINYPNLT